MSETGAGAADDPGSVPTTAGPGVELDPADAPEDGPDPSDSSDDAPEPSWWQRSHPTFAGLVGFFAGVAYVIIVPGVYAALLGLLVSESTAKQLFPLVLVALVIPLVMLVSRKTRRFAEFMFLGIVSTVVVVALTTTLVIWVMVKLGQ
jgi:heme/copper-type cytochrome/quinol oxidase subunit 4